MILYNTDMKIPISNTLYGRKNRLQNIKNVDSKVLNNLSFQSVNAKKFPSVHLIKKCFSLGTSTPTIINASNEVLVNLFLNKKIGFLDIVKTINMIFKDKDFKTYAKKRPKSLKDVLKIDNWARLKTTSMCVKYN
jgi:1-deoxy-D-xylulose-5-phosphate reductoisomerase